MSKITDPDQLDRFQVCIDPVAETISLRGLGTVRHALDQTGDSAGTTTFTDAGANFTTDGVLADDILTIISDPANNGGIIGHYRVVTVGTTTLTVERSIPASTGADLTYKINSPQTTGAAGAQVADGVNMQALFSFLKEEWITLAGGLGNAQDLNKFDFPMLSITPEQFILGGVNGDAASFWSFNDTNGVTAAMTEGTTRQLLRDGGWQERNASDVVLRESANITTLGSMDSDAQPYFQQGNSTGTPADFKLTGPVNQAILTLGPDVGPDAVATGFAFAATTITRNDGGNWATDNYRIGDFVKIRAAEDDPANNGTFGPITAVADAADGAITIASASFTVNASDTTAIFSVDHRKYTKLFVRKKGMTYASAAHADAGIPSTGIQPLVNKFPLAHATDPAIAFDDGQMAGDGTNTVFSDAETHTTGVDGDVADVGSGTFTFTSVGSTFNSTARGAIVVLQVGDALQISTGTLAYRGHYVIKSIDGATVLTCYNEPTKGVMPSQSGLTFTVRTRIRDVGATNGALANVDGATGTLTSAGSTFDANTAIGDRLVVAGDMVIITAGTAAHLGICKVISVDSATQLTLNTSDQVFTTVGSQTYKIFRPGMYLQRFETTGVASGMTDGLNIDGAGDPDTFTRIGGSWVSNGFIVGSAISLLDAEDAANIGSYIVGTPTPTATVLTLIASESVTTNIDDDTAVNGNVTFEYGIIRSVNSVAYPFHWRLFANGGTLSQVFQFLQWQLRKKTDIDLSTGINRGDITDLLMTFASPNGVTLDLFPDNLSASELNNVTYTDLTSDARNNAFLVGITFDVNANLIGSTTKRLTVYFTTNPAGNFGTNTAVIVDDSDTVDMDYTTIAGDFSTVFDYTNNAQGGRAPGTNADVTVVALGDTDAQHILVTATITQVNSLTIAIPNALERNYST